LFPILRMIFGPEPTLAGIDGGNGLGAQACGLPQA
jgi:hypothetical protein